MPFVSDLRTVLRGRGFRRLFVVRLASQGSDGAFQAALASLVFFSPERAATAHAAAGAFAVSVLPYTVVGPFAGVLLDRWRRRQVLLTANAVRTALVLGVALLVSQHVVGVVLYAAALGCLSVNRFFLSGLGASLPHVVDDDELVMANSVSPTCGTIMAIVGGGIAYGVREVLGAGDGTDAVLLVLAAAGYATSALLTLRLRPGQLGPDRDVETRPADGLQAIIDGARHVHGRRPAWNALGAMGLHRFAYGITVITTILLCRNYFNDPSDVDAGVTLLALAFGASAVGFGLAALLTPPAADRWGPGGVIWRSYALAAVVEAVFITRFEVPIALAGALLLGICAQSSKICVDTIVQEYVDDDYRGRVFSFYDMVFNLAFVVAAAFAALLLPSDGYSRAVFAVVALLYALAALGYGRTVSAVATQDARR
ncbi:MAG TPA: MFS transporter [Actinomycetales bacterium]|nr:MFS transporter [Actinomycetales bacterium]